MKRREFLASGLLALGSLSVFDYSATGAVQHKYRLAAENLLPADIRNAPIEVREAYRFAIANRDTLRYIPCYCGCGEQGHTSNASCYIEDNSPPGKLIFDRMSLG
jgi:hypothetical protein